ncbi:MAG: DnaB-like helicase N-terminal domain-containing protein, partial [candidate division WOR-3 bacterium]
MPSAIESENTIIALMLTYPSECIGRVVEKLTIDDFSNERNREIFSTIKELYLNRNKEFIDVAMIIDELERKGTLEKVGGKEYLIEIIEKFYSTPELLEEHINIVIEKSIYRKIIETSQVILNEAQKGERRADDLLDFAEARILEIRDRGIRKDFVHISEIIEHQKKEIIERYEVKSRIIGIPTGISF